MQYIFNNPDWQLVSDHAKFYLDSEGLISDIFAELRLARAPNVGFTTQMDSTNDSYGALLHAFPVLSTRFMGQVRCFAPAASNGARRGPGKVFIVENFS
ncbi:MAG TPA: hypothetical protein VIY68_13685 [Steroidobacteraceae bacterium]